MLPFYCCASLHTFIIIHLCYFYLAYFLKYSSCVYHTLLYICLLPYFILVYIIYFLNIDVSICMDGRRIGCWSPVVTSLAYIFTVYNYVMLLLFCKWYVLYASSQINNNNNKVKNIATKRGFFNLKSSQMSYLALSASFEYLCYGSTAIRNSLLFQCGDRLYTSESDVSRRQILTYKEFRLKI